MTVATIYEPRAWSLDELFPALDAPEVESAMRELDALVAQMEAYRPQLTPEIAPAAFLEIVRLDEAITEAFYRLYGFGNLSFAANTQNQNALAYLARMGQFAAQVQNRTLFFSLWWKELEDDKAEALLAEAGDWTYYLRHLRMERPYTLSEAEEKIVNLKNVNGRRAFDQLYDSIVNRYVFKLTVNGEEKQLTREQLAVYYRSPDPTLRAAAYRELNRVYGYDAPILGQIYQAMMRDWRSEFVDVRGHASPIAVRNHNNDIPNAVVETLLGVMRRNASLFHRFFRLKARWLGMAQLRRTDIYAPVAASDKSYTFHEAVQLVLESFHEFDPRIAALAQRVFDDNHYDGETRLGKMGGAFCSTLGPRHTPWVLQSFQGKPNDVATMAHELGHAVHSLLADHHSILTQSASLPLAETASTFGEMLLLDKLLTLDGDAELRRELLFGQMDDHYATIMRQSYFAIFETAAHEAIHAGASVDALSDLYLANLREQFGDAVAVDDDFRHEWVSIPHFYGTPFYVYAYAFGQLLALALYRQYKAEGAAMLPRYIALLAAGGSQPPVEILSQAGFDVYSADFWQGGFDLIAEQLAELEALPIPGEKTGHA